jgi:hypothetical protein
MQFPGLFIFIFYQLIEFPVFYGEGGVGAELAGGFG